MSLGGRPHRRGERSASGHDSEPLLFGMRTLWEKLEPLRDEPDLGVGILLAVAFAVLHILNVVGSDVVAAATLSLLALLAFSLLLERQRRDEIRRTLNEVRQELAETVTSISTEIDDAISALSSDYAYQTRWLELRYDLGPNGATALATKTREIRFTRNDVLSIYEHYAADGRATKPIINGGKKGGYKIPLPSVRSLRDDRGRPIELVSLEKPRKRGEVMEIVSERTLTNSFVDAREYVHVEIKGRTDEVIFHVIWPKGNPPLQLELSRRGGQRTVGIPLERLKLNSDGRQVLVERICDPEDEEVITLFWDWEISAVRFPDSSDDV